MQITDFLHRAHAGRVRITLDGGYRFTGRFRTDILSPSAVSAYFYGDERDVSLTIADVISVEAIPPDALAS